VNHGDKVLDDMDGLIRLLAGHVSDRSTLDELHGMIADRKSWRRGHDLFSRIREKVLNAERAGDGTLACQYLFEEICAKTLYNMSGEPAPFDADSPYWIIPNAIAFARRVGVPDAKVIELVAA
jgi:hypothetical protein